jgi:methionine-rich copper-binding protein CopC
MRRHFLVLLLGLTWLASFASSAWAHAILLQATPAPNATVEGPDLSVELKFNSRIDTKRSRVTVLTPDKSDKSARVLANEASSPPDTLVARGKGFAPGEYRLKWQVLSSDGHITRGEHPFTIQ